MSSRKCECGYSISWFSHYDYSMRRIYITKSENKKKRIITIGYFCPRCPKIELEPNILEIANKYIRPYKKKNVYLRITNKGKTKEYRIGEIVLSKDKTKQIIPANIKIDQDQLKLISKFFPY